MVDQRKDKRAQASLKVKYKSATVDQFIEQFGSDVSRGGIFIKTKKPLETGAFLKLELQLNDASPVIHGVGRVCFRRETASEPNLPAGMGIKFIKLDPGSRAIVERIVNARGDKPSRFDQTEGAELAPPSLPPEADEFGDLRLSGAPEAAVSAPPRPAPPARAARPVLDAVPPAVTQPADGSRRPAPPPAAPPRAPTQPARPPISTPLAPRPGSGSRPFPAAGSGSKPNPLGTTGSGATTSPLGRSQGSGPNPFARTSGSGASANPSSAAARNPAFDPPRGPAKQGFPAMEPSKPQPRATPAAGVQRRAGGGVAGLFADSPLSQSPAAVEPSVPNGRSSFFPPEGGADADMAPPRGRARDLGSQKPPFASRAPAEAARAEQARHSGEFLAAAFEAGGVTRATTEQARATAAAVTQQRGEDALIDELFAGVVEPAKPSAPPARNGSGAPGDVEDMFAELSQEEGLAGARRASAPGAIPAPRASQPEPANDGDNVDDLFAELSAPSRPPARAAAAASSGLRASAPGARPASARPLAPPPPSGAPGPLSVPEGPAAESEWDDEPQSNEADLGGLGESGPAPMFSEPPRLSPSTPPAPQSALDRAARPSSAAVLIGIAVLVFGAAGGGYFYYTKVVQAPATVAVPLAPDANDKPASAVPVAAPNPNAPAAAPSAAAAEPATIEVEVTSSPRGAEVEVDGKPRGVTPLRVALVPGKPSQVSVSSAGYARENRSVTVESGQEPLRFKLEPLPFSLVVRTIPEGAELTAGTSVATAPGPLALGHLDGSVLVSVGKSGFQRMTRPVRLDEFTEQNGVMRAEIEVRLSALPGGGGGPEPVRARIRRRADPDEPPAPPSPPAPSEAAPAPEAPAPAAEAAPAAPTPAPAEAAPAAPDPPPGLPELPPDVAKPE